MKRSDIKVGDELYFARGNDWAIPAYGDGRGRKVIVRGLWWREADRRFGFGTEAREVPEGTKGAGMLVEGENNVGGKTCEVVSPALLRGPYEKTAAEVAAFVRKRDERQRATASAIDAMVQARDAALLRADALGLKARRGSGSDAPYVVLAPAELQRLLDVYEVAPLTARDGA